jgi:hypothetical protein
VEFRLSLNDGDEFRKSPRMSGEMAERSKAPESGSGHIVAGVRIPLSSFVFTNAEPGAWPVDASQGSVYVTPVVSA